MAQDLRQWLDNLPEALHRPDGIEILQALLEYIHHVSETPAQKLHHLMTQLGPEAQEASVTTADMLRAEGEAKGRAEGRAEERVETLTRLLTLKFGPLPDSTQAKLHTATVEQLATWTDRVLTATTLDEIFD